MSYSRPPTRPVALANTCDYIVVGAGSGGSVLTSRLETAFRTCVIDITDDEQDQWTEKYPVGKNFKSPWQYAFGKGLGGSTLVNSGVYTRGDLSDYEEWGGSENWSKNITRSLFKSLEHFTEAPGFPVHPENHPTSPYEAPQFPRSHVSLVAAQKNELPKLLRRTVEEWEKAGLGEYRVDPHEHDDMSGGISGTWRFAGCGNSMDVACTPQRASRWRHVGHEREHQSADKLLMNPKIYLGTVTKVLFDTEGEEPLAKGVEFVNKNGQYTLNPIILRNFDY